MKLLKSCKIYTDPIDTSIESEMLRYTGPRCNKAMFRSEERPDAFCRPQADLCFKEQYKAGNFHSLQ